VTYSAGWRFNDQALAKNIIAVSYGDNFPIYRFCGVWPWCGQLQFNLEGGLWAVFDPDSESSNLMNADYYVGFPIEYAVGRWSFRIRPYHISSHLGDEHIVFNPGIERLNPSAEYLDGFVSWYVTDEIRLYAGVGWVIQHDESFKQGHFYSEWGAELRLPQLGFFCQSEHLYGLPFFGMHFRYQDPFERNLNADYALGWEYGKTVGLQKRVRIFLLYHDGQSVDGQFSSSRTNYLALTASYGF